MAHRVIQTVTFADDRSPHTSTHTDSGKASNARREWVEFIKHTGLRWWPDGLAVINETSAGHLVRREWQDL